MSELHRYYIVDEDKLIPRVTLSGFDKGFDKDEQKTIILAKANMLIYMSGLIKEHPDMTQQFAHLFNDTFLLQTNSILGTLARPVYDKYDLILTNPPYVMSGSSNLKEEISKQAELKNYFRISAMGIEGLFMEWIVRSLKPGGKAFVVVPDGIMNRSNDKRLRDFILGECFVDAVISLPLNTFFTTNKKTYILALTKKQNIRIGGIETKPRQMTPVFTYICSEIGETRDVNRFDIDQNDLENAADLFNMFKGSKARFSTEDKRCKIANIEDFYSGSHWSVDRWWTHEEKIALGMEDGKTSVSLSAFRVILSDVVDTLSEFDEPLSEIEESNDGNEITKEFSVNEVFRIVRGSGKYTKAYIQKHQGEYPVYSGNTTGAFASIESYDYSDPCLSWAIDGLAGHMMIHEEPFSATNHRGVLLPKSDSVNMEYAKYILEPIFRELKKGRTGDNGENEYTSLPPYMVENVRFYLPVTDKGEFDIDTQRIVAQKIVYLEQMKHEIVEKMDALIIQKIDLSSV